MAIVQLDEAITLPQDLVIIMQTGRKEFASTINRSFTKKESKDIAHAIGVMSDKLQRQQNEINRLKDRIQDLHNMAEEKLNIIAGKAHEVRQTIKELHDGTVSSDSD